MSENDKPVYEGFTAVGYSGVNYTYENGQGEIFRNGGSTPEAYRVNGVVVPADEYALQARLERIEKKLDDLLARSSGEAK